MATPFIRQPESTLSRIPLTGIPSNTSQRNLTQGMLSTGPLLDTFGRVHRSLRVSVTDRCNLRCTYCMPEEATFLSGNQLLSRKQILQVVSAGAGLGITKIRLTGGEPLLRKDLVEIVGDLTQVEGIEDLSLTTNGILLTEFAKPLFLAGLQRLTISLDTLKEDNFQRLARRDGLPRVLSGIDAALKAGFRETKLNAVILKGVNEDEIVPLASYARERNITLRFIESMPIGADPWDRDAMVSGKEIQNTLEAKWGPLVACLGQNPHAPALDFQFADGRGKIGLIMSVTRPFCGQCDRLRLTADGKLRNCLFSLEETDLRNALESQNGLESLQMSFRKSVWGKWEGHEINTARFLKPDRTMHAIGG